MHTTLAAVYVSLVPNSCQTRRDKKRATASVTLYSLTSQHIVKLGCAIGRASYVYINGMGSRSLKREFEHGSTINDVMTMGEEVIGKRLQNGAGIALMGKVQVYVVRSRSGRPPLRAGNGAADSQRCLQLFKRVTM